MEAAVQQGIDALSSLEERINPSTVVEVEPNDALAFATAFSLTSGPTGLREFSLEDLSVLHQVGAEA